MINNAKKQYIFLDESGKPEIFSAKGINLVECKQATKYLILAAVRTSNQLKLQQDITEFKAKLLKNVQLTTIFSSSYALDALHANNDYPAVRECFYQFITTLDLKIDVMVVEKLKCYDVLQRQPAKLYGVMAGQLLKNICHQSNDTEIIFSRKDSKLKLRYELEIEVERARLEYLQQHPNITTQIKLTYHHNPHYTHGGLQVADYISYAIFQAYEHQNYALYKLIQNKIGKIQDICNKKYFTRSNPLELSR